MADIGSSEPAVDGRSVRWSQAPFGFELGSSDPETLERARVVFRPWMNAPVAAPHRRWTVDRTPAGAWLVHDSLSPGPIERPTAVAAVRTVEFRAVNGLVESAEATLHAALVARGERGIAILGSTETGKSTLGAALWQRGFSLLGDDVTVVDPTDARAWPAPRRVGLRSASRDLLADAIWSRIHRSPGCDVTDEGCLFHPDEVDAGPRPSSVRLAALVFLGRRDAAPEPAGASARARPRAAGRAALSQRHQAGRPGNGDPSLSAVEDTRSVLRPRPGRHRCDGGGGRGAADRACGMRTAPRGVGEAGPWP